MLFQSFIFIFVFLPVVFALYWSVRNQAFRWAMLLVASYIFYGYWDYRFCGLIFFSSTVDYLVGLQIPKAKSLAGKRAWLSVSLVSNLGLLGFFKYWDFFADSTDRLAEALGLQPIAPLLHIVLPAGISFYTFHALSYTIDIYRGKVVPTRSPIKFLLFVSFFPQLVAGPILRYSQLTDQLDNMPKQFNWKEVSLGACFVIIGLFKKLWIADTLARMINPALANYSGLGFWQFWPTIFAWDFQIYFDFSAYSDIAVGLGLLLGFHIPINFDSPYRSESISELWRRWHISLNTWLRDYLFFSLGGSKKGTPRLFLNLFLIFFLAGLWHGAKWTYALFGVYCGLMFALEEGGRRLKINIPTVALRRALVFLFWTGSAFFFRATDLHMTKGLAKAAFGLNGLGKVPEWTLMAMVAFCFVHSQAVPNTWHWKWKFTWWEAVVLAILFIVCLARMFGEQPFIYFQF